MENFSAEHLLIVFALTTFAGLATGIGGAIGFFVRRTNTRLLTFFLGLSAGVMIFISFVEMFASAQRDLAEIFGHVRGGLFALGAFFGGIGVAMLIDRLVPEESNPHETHGAEELDAPARVVPAGEMRRTGFLFMLAIGIHNFPEGMATFAAGLDGLALGVPIAVAVALHNIPEGLAVGFAFREGARSPVPSSPRRGAGRRRFFIRSRRGWRSRSARWSGCSCCSRFFLRRCLRRFSRRWRASWSSFRSTSCCRCRSAGATITFRSAESSWACC